MEWDKLGEEGCVSNKAYKAREKKTLGRFGESLSENETKNLEFVEKLTKSKIQNSKKKS